MTGAPKRPRTDGKRVALVAIGGHSFVHPGEPATIDTQRARLTDTSRAIAGMVHDGWRIVVTHGNGPQVGAALLRSERAVANAYPLPLDMCVASTQGEMGVLLQQGLGAALDARTLPQSVATLVTQVVVSLTDPGFAHPSKPIGAALTPAEAEARRAEGWTVGEEPFRGYRRRVPSPEPLEVVEEPAIRALVDAGVLVVALGGGGVPVARKGGRLSGVEAVVDKDLSSALLAIQLEVALLAIVTDVDGVYVNFAQPDARLLRDTTADDLRRHAADGHFPPGTMGPKVEAVLRFIDAGGPEAIVASPTTLVAALDGRAGTRVVPEIQGRWRRREGRAGRRSNDRWTESER